MLIMNKPKISIIIPCYKVENVLDRCIKSVVNQDLKDIEIILIDDKSPDSVPYICDCWSKRDKRIKVIHKEKNEGLGYARNSGLKIATGEYVAFVDSDDYIAQNMYSTLYKCSDNSQIDAVFCGLIQELPDHKYNYIRDYDVNTTFNKEHMNLLALSFLRKTELNLHSRLFMSVWHGIYKRSIIKDHNISFYSEREILSEDLPFQITFFRNSNLVKFIPDYLYTYCLNPQSLTSQFNKSKITAAFNLRDLLYTIVPASKDSSFFIDTEFYGRIRYLLTEMVFSSNINKIDKYVIIKQLCNNEIWKRLNIRIKEEKYRWKYIQQFKLLLVNRPVLLLLFIIFDRKINYNEFKFLCNKIRKQLNKIKSLY